MTMFRRDRMPACAASTTRSCVFRVIFGSLLALAVFCRSGVLADNGSGTVPPGNLMDVFKAFKSKSARSLRMPMNEDVSMDITDALQARRKALAACRSPQLKKSADLATQWWNWNTDQIVCQMGRHVTRVYEPDTQRTNKNNRFIVMQTLNMSANHASTVARNFGDTVAKAMNYKDFDHWMNNWEFSPSLPCLPPPDSGKFLDNFRDISRMSKLRSLALFWHGNLQSYFLFFSMAGTYRAATTDLTEAALNYSCGLFDVLQIVRNILVQMEMRKGFKPGAPPSSDCMETACAYTVDPLMRLALGIRDSLALLADVRRRIDEFRAYYDDDDDAERRS